MAVLKYFDGTDWEPVVSALQGPTGPSITGATGPTGTTGATGTVEGATLGIQDVLMLGGM
jgi:hypothetical protein